MSFRYMKTRRMAVAQSLAEFTIGIFSTLRGTWSSKWTLVQDIVVRNPSTWVGWCILHRRFAIERQVDVGMT